MDPITLGLIAASSAPAIAGLFQKKPGRPDISGELARIDGLFAQMAAQGRANVNREAAQGRTAAASNLAARGTLRSGVANHTFNALEGERLNAIANVEANVAGQQAQARSAILRALLGMDQDDRIRQQQQTAGRFGAISGLASNLLFANLMRGQGYVNPIPATAWKS